MSLINDALRRADVDRRRRDAGADPPAPPPLPPEEAQEPQTPPSSRGRSPWTMVLAGVFLILVGLTAYGVWWGIGRPRETAGLAVRSATAALQKTAKHPSAVAAASKAAPAPSSAATSVQTRTGSAKEPAAEAPDQTATAGATPEPAETAVTPASQPTEAAVPAAQPSPGGEAARDLADGWTPDLLLRDPPDAADASVGTGATEGPGPALFNRMLAILQAAARDAAQGQQPTGPAGQPQAAADQRPAPTVEAPRGADGSADATEKRPDAARDKDRVKAPAGGLFDTGPAAPEPTPKKPGRAPAPLPPVDTSAFKISSILKGPGGGVAIINGRPVHEGETVAGAKVVRISGRAVELEIDGRRATVGM